jgi:hypothetical protein
MDAPTIGSHHGQVELALVGIEGFDGFAPFLGIQPATGSTAADALPVLAPGRLIGLGGAGHRDGYRGWQRGGHRGGGGNGIHSAMAEKVLAMAGDKESHGWGKKSHGQGW